MFTEVQACSSKNELTPCNLEMLINATVYEQFQSGLCDRVDKRWRYKTDVSNFLNFSIAKTYFSKTQNLEKLLVLLFLTLKMEYMYKHNV